MSWQRLPDIQVEMIFSRKKCGQESCNSGNLLRKVRYELARIKSASRRSHEYDRAVLTRRLQQDMQLLRDVLGRARERHDHGQHHNENHQALPRLTDARN